MAEGTPGGLAGRGRRRGHDSGPRRASTSSLSARRWAAEVPRTAPGRYRSPPRRHRRSRPRWPPGWPSATATLTDLRSMRSLEEAYLAVVGSRTPTPLGPARTAGGSRPTSAAARGTGDVRALRGPGPGRGRDDPAAGRDPPADRRDPGHLLGLLLLGPRGHRRGPASRSPSTPRASWPWPSCRPPWCPSASPPASNGATGSSNGWARPRWAGPAPRGQDRRHPGGRDPPGGRAGAGRHSAWVGTRPHGDAAPAPRRRWRSSCWPRSASGASGSSWPASLRAEVNLAAANGLYLVLLLLGGMIVPLGKLPAGVAAIAQVLPPAALSTDCTPCSARATACPSGRGWCSPSGPSWHRRPPRSPSAGSSASRRGSGCRSPATRAAEVMGPYRIAAIVPLPSMKTASGIAGEVVVALGHPRADRSAATGKVTLQRTGERPGRWPCPVRHRPRDSGHLGHGAPLGLLGLVSWRRSPGVSAWHWPHQFPKNNSTAGPAVAPTVDRGCPPGPTRSMRAP